MINVASLVQISYIFGITFLAPSDKMSLLTVAVRWLLAGYCGLILLHLTDGMTKDLQITQKPRFYRVTTTKKVSIYCVSSRQHQPSTALWYKASTFNSDKVKIQNGISVQSRDRTENAILILKELKPEDQGFYFCEINNVTGPGTEVQVARRVNIANVLYRSQVKDGLIILQALLLAVFIGAFGFRKKSLAVKKECIYEEPEVDHIYEGLAIETCEGDLYEEISVYAQPEGAEAPWE